jgi:hypothetical protein
MGGLGRVTGSEDRGAYRDVTVDTGGGAVVSAPLYAPPGVDAPPLPGDVVALTDAKGSGEVAALGVAVEPGAEPGELWLFARNSSGVIVATIKLSASGKVTVNGNLEVLP